MSRRKMPVQADGVLLAEHRNGRGRVVAETRAHFNDAGAVSIVRWQSGRLPEEWATLDVEAADKLQGAIRQHTAGRLAREYRQRMAAQDAMKASEK